MYVAKEEFILQRASGRSVLHLGAVGFTDLAPGDRVRSAEQSLHWKLTQLSETIGIDRSVAVIDEYRKLGVFTNIVAGDVEQLDELQIERTFDVVIAGDIIEHLSNPGRMLDGIKRFCTENTQVIITTPNAFGAPNFLRYSAGKFREGAEHVMSFNEQSLVTLLTRHGYSISELHMCFQPRSADQHSTFFFTLGRKVFELFPRFGGTLLAVARVRPTTA
ncbi:MAG: methyltransferase domain-containing protein [Candidatus Korobacteraceae bacterium]